MSPITASAKQLLNELLSAQKKGAKYSQESPETRPLLKKLIILECKKFCREDGGKSLDCPVRTCCDQHKIIGCWKCRDLDVCKKLKPQFFINSKKLKKLGMRKYIEQYK